MGHLYFRLTFSTNLLVAFSFISFVCFPEKGITALKTFFRLDSVVMDAVSDSENGENRR